MLQIRQTENLKMTQQLADTDKIKTQDIHKHNQHRKPSYKYTENYYYFQLSFSTIYIDTTPNRWITFYTVPDCYAIVNCHNKYKV